MKVAVIGAGVSGCRLAQILSLHSPQFTFKVDVFDAGRECGGRSSTRIHANQVGEDFFFDHGAQYISKGKTLDFQKLMEEWLLAGTVKGWKGKVGVWDRDHFQDEHENDRWTPIPTMNSLCKTMLGANSEGITTHYSCRVKAESCGTIGGNGWNLYDMKTGSHLGCWDVLVSTDRKFCPISVDSQLTSEFIEPLRLAVTDVPSLAVMVAYDEATSKTIDSFPYTSVQILDHPILSWISRCSSQPGRERSDGSACWVLHSTSSFATDVIQQVTDAEREGRVSNTRKAVASAAEGPMHQVGHLRAHFPPFLYFSFLFFSKLVVIHSHHNLIAQSPC